QMAATEPSNGGNFNEDKVKPFTAQDVRFTTKGATLYAFVMGAPTSVITIESLGTAAKLYEGAIGSVRLLGSDEQLTWSHSADALTISAPGHVPNDIAVVFEIKPVETRR
ncbi:MAG TPA: alpha-L-fucosidase C-terminal domain-containing protein, partial [Opitutus sp.]|nr:alpha-L-fucosidase C-terminal domain-containing protein [Opitutus sp.]